MVKPITPEEAKDFSKFRPVRLSSEVIDFINKIIVSYLYQEKTPHVFRELLREFIANNDKSNKYSKSEFLDIWRSIPFTYAKSGWTVEGLTSFSAGPYYTFTQS